MIDHIWEFEGETREEAATQDRTLNGTPKDPFPTDDVVQVSKSIILSEASAKFQEEMARVGVNAVITLIEPEAWVTVRTEARQHRDWTIYTFYHRLHLKARVHFRADQPLVSSPVDPATLSVLVTVVKYLIGVLAAALVTYAIAKTFIESFLVKKHVITKVNPQTGEVTTEEFQEPEPTSVLTTALVAFAGLAVLLWFLTRRR